MLLRSEEPESAEVSSLGSSEDSAEVTFGVFRQ